VHKSSLYLPEKLKAGLARRAKESGRSEAEVVRDALQAALADPGPPAAEPERPVPGRLVGVGVGPGEADLLTLRAAAALRRASRVLAPSTAVDAVGRAEAIVRQALPDVAVERVPFAMAPSRASRDVSVERAAEVVAHHLSAGEEVAWVTLGDPLVYSTFAAVAAGVKKRRPGTAVLAVPGIMAFQALAARTVTVITDERERLVIRTALDDEDLAADLDDPETTVVIYKGGRRLPEVAAALATAGRLDGAVMGELIGLPGQRITPLSAASQSPASYLATVIAPASGGSR
jgi:precorrin-2/cobalt-factor-2 C20-methyltransferase